MKSIYQKIYEQAKPFLRTRNNLIHTKISFQYALRLLKQVKGKEDIVIPAILLHDVGWKTIPANLHLTAYGPNPSNPKLARVHEVKGAKIARTILEELRYPPEKVGKICQIIRGHDSRKRAVSRSDRIVKDADKLWRYSRRGFEIETVRFHLSGRKLINYLEGKIEPWFFLSTSRQWAREELVRRRREMGYTKPLNGSTNLLLNQSP